jgi:hypothetical protein
MNTAGFVFGSLHRLMAFLLSAGFQSIEDFIDRGLMPGIFCINQSLCKILVTVFVGLGLGSDGCLRSY